MDRRSFLGASALLGLAGRLATADRADAAEAFVTSETGQLKRVIVHPPGDETRKAFPMFFGGHSMLTWELLRDDATEQHEAFVECLTESGAEVLFFKDILNESIAQARSTGHLEPWLKEEAPHFVEHQEEITASVLLGDDKFIYLRDDTGVFRPQATPVTTLYFTRDIAVMTPKGVVICNFNNLRRRFEAKLTQFAFEHSPTLQRYPVAFDAIKEQVYVQGGDVMVLDETTLLVGVGNTTQEEAAALLANALDMDVIAVQLPPAGRMCAWEGLQIMFYHLDCLIGIVDRRKVLAVPYLLEKQYVSRNPLLEVLYGFARMEGLDKADSVNLLDLVRNVGWIRRYKAGSGERDTKLGSLKLLDFLKQEGYQTCHVGGDKLADESDLKHLVEDVIRECRFMGTNVVATKPGHVISYEGNSGTQSALSQAGIEVTTFPSHELVRASGGPHCLTMPLERAEA